nr:MAG TPA: hypothetical protein [Caudoviricetes sp.]
MASLPLITIPNRHLIPPLKKTAHWAVFFHLNIQNHLPPVPLGVFFLQIKFP